MADHHSAAPPIPYREGGEVGKLLYVIVNQISQSTGQRWKQEHTGKTNNNIVVTL